MVRPITWMGPAALVFLLGFGIILVTTRSAHLLVAPMGMRFTHWFVGKLVSHNPGEARLCARYLRPGDIPGVDAYVGRHRHQLMPFIFLCAAIAADVPTWVVWPQVVVWSRRDPRSTSFGPPKKSDWKKFSREMEFVDRRDRHDGLVSQEHRPKWTRTSSGTERPLSSQTLGCLATNQDLLNRGEAGRYVQIFAEGSCRVISAVSTSWCPQVGVVESWTHCVQVP